jgi:hypothetical protein
MLAAAPSRSEYAPVVPSLATASLDAAERRALERFVGLLRKRFGEDLDAVWLYSTPWISWIRKVRLRLISAACS